MKAMTMKKRMLGVIAAGALALSIVAVPAQAAEVPLTAIPFGDQVTPGDPSLVVTVPQGIVFDDVKKDQEKDLDLQAWKLNDQSKQYEKIDGQTVTLPSNVTGIKVTATSENEWSMKYNSTGITYSYKTNTEDGDYEDMTTDMTTEKASANIGSKGVLHGVVKITGETPTEQSVIGQSFKDVITFTFEAQRSN